MKKKKIEFKDQVKTSETFFLKNCDAMKYINFKTTNFGWGAIVSKWAGVEVTPEAIHKAVSSFDLPNQLITPGVYAYGIIQKKAK